MILKKLMHAKSTGAIQDPPRDPQRVPKDPKGTLWVPLGDQKKKRVRKTQKDDRRRKEKGRRKKEERRQGGKKTAARRKKKQDRTKKKKRKKKEEARKERTPKRKEATPYTPPHLPIDRPSGYYVSQRKEKEGRKKEGSRGRREQEEQGPSLYIPNSRSPAPGGQILTTIIILPTIISY